MPESSQAGSPHSLLQMGSSSASKPIAVAAMAEPEMVPTATASHALSNGDDFNAVAARVSAKVVAKGTQTDLPSDTAPRIGNHSVATGWHVLLSTLSDLVRGSQDRIATRHKLQAALSTINVFLVILLTLIVYVLGLAICLLYRAEEPKPEQPAVLPQRSTRQVHEWGGHADSAFPLPRPGYRGEPSGAAPEGLGGHTSSSEGEASATRGGRNIDWMSPSMRLLAPPPTSTSMGGLGAGATPPPTQRTLPATAPLSPQGQAVASPSSMYLSPGLVVPKGNECVVAVRVQNEAAHATFPVYEMSGKPVIEVELFPPVWSTTPGAGRTDDPPVVLLRAANEPKMLVAYCKLGSELGKRRSVCIFNARDEMFGQIVKVMTFSQMPRHATSPTSSPSGRHSEEQTGKPRYVFTSGRAGMQLVFNGNFQEHAFQITNENHDILADAEPCEMSFDPSGSYYKLRVSETVDVGIILCTLFAIGRMEVNG